MKPLVVIPARGGSKGIPRKNICPLNGKPLIFHTIDAARGIVCDENICVTTDDDEIIELVEQYGLKVPFKRPANLATDEVGSYEVIVHAINFYENKGKYFDIVILLQPTSPFRNSEHVKEALLLFTKDIDMVVSVKETKANPYFNLVEEDENSYLIKSKKGNFIRRQDCPKVWQYNGAIYIINVDSLKRQPINTFEKIKKYKMNEIQSIDIDTPLDLAISEYIIKYSGS